MNRTTYFNKHFRFVYTPNFNNGLLDFLFNSKRFLIGAGSIRFWIGEKNAETVLKSAEKMTTDKLTLKFRKYGKIEIYNK